MQNEENNDPNRPKHSYYKKRVEVQSPTELYSELTQSYEDILKLAQFQGEVVEIIDGSLEDEVYQDFDSLPVSISKDNHVLSVSSLYSSSSPSSQSRLDNEGMLYTSPLSTPLKSTTSPSLPSFSTDGYRPLSLSSSVPSSPKVGWQQRLLNRLKTQRETHRKQVAGIEAKASQKDFKIKELQNQMEHLKHEVEHKEQTIQRHERRLSMSQGLALSPQPFPRSPFREVSRDGTGPQFFALEEAREEAKKYKSLNQKLHQDISKLNAELGACQEYRSLTKLRNLEKEKEELEQKLEKKEMSLQKFKEQMQTLNKRLNEALVKVKQYDEGFQKIKSKLEEQRRARSEKCSPTISRVNEKEREIERLTKECASYRVTIRDLEKKYEPIKDIVIKLEGRTRSSVRKSRVLGTLFVIQLLLLFLYLSFDWGSSFEEMPSHSLT